MWKNEPLGFISGKWIENNNSSKRNIERCKREFVQRSLHCRAFRFFIWMVTSLHISPSRSLSCFSWNSPSGENVCRRCRLFRPSHVVPVRNKARNSWNQTEINKTGSFTHFWCIVVPQISHNFWKAVSHERHRLNSRWDVVRTHNSHPEKNDSDQTRKKNRCSNFHLTSPIFCFRLYFW